MRNRCYEASQYIAHFTEIDISSVVLLNALIAAAEDSFYQDPYPDEDPESMNARIQEYSQQVRPGKRDCRKCQETKERQEKEQVADLAWAQKEKRRLTEERQKVDAIGENLLLSIRFLFHSNGTVNQDSIDKYRQENNPLESLRQSLSGYAREYTDESSGFDAKLFLDILVLIALLAGFYATPLVIPHVSLILVANAVEIICAAVLIWKIHSINWNHDPKPLYLANSEKIFTELCGVAQGGLQFFGSKLKFGHAPAVASSLLPPDYKAATAARP